MLDFNPPKLKHSTWSLPINIILLLQQKIEDKGKREKDKSKHEAQQDNYS